MEPKLDQVIEILQKEGMNAEQIKSFIQSLNNALALNMYGLLSDTLTEDEMANLNTIVEDVDRQASLRYLVEKKLGVKLEDLSNKFVQDFTSQFVKHYQEEKQNPSTLN